MSLSPASSSETPATRLPVLFISHGSPMLALNDGPAHRFLLGLAADLPRPKAILVISAHWETEKAEVSAAAQPRTIHDFGPFDPRLFKMSYPAPGAPDLAQRVVELLSAADIPAKTHPSRGFDHGAWVPLRLVYPQADIPVVQLSLQSHREPDYHLKVGAALAPLRDEGVLIIASGAVTHNLYAFRGQPQDDPPEPWASAFAEWVAQMTQTGDVAALSRFDTTQLGQINHPTDEHFLPFFVMLGAAGGRAERIHASIAHTVIAMDVYKAA